MLLFLIPGKCLSFCAGSYKLLPICNLLCAQFADEIWKNIIALQFDSNVFVNVTKRDDVGKGGQVEASFARLSAEPTFVQLLVAIH